MRDIVNGIWADLKPELSVLIPFLNDDPTALVQALCNEADSIGSRVEIVLFDDGTGSAKLTAELTSLVQSSAISARLITAEQNLGRAKGRNQMARSARGEYLLFLDADMLPDSANFLAQWFEFIVESKAKIAFGGFSLKQAPAEKAYIVHRAMALKSDCTPAHIRELQPEKHLYTSNLMVRSDVFEVHSFDENFKGWGWEDVEWAMRVSDHHEINHPDITATHMGLDAVPTLMRKYEQSASNFARVARLHPHLVQNYPSYKVAKAIQKRGMAVPVATVSRWIAKQAWMPVGIRGLNLRVYRSALYAVALEADKA